jgi:hypothetical protein
MGKCLPESGKRICIWVRISITSIGANKMLMREGKLDKILENLFY